MKPKAWNSKIPEATPETVYCFNLLFCIFIQQLIFSLPACILDLDTGPVSTLGANLLAHWIWFWFCSLQTWRSMQHFGEAFKMRKRIFKILKNNRCFKLRIRPNSVSALKFIYANSITNLTKWNRERCFYCTKYRQEMTHTKNKNRKWTTTVGERTEAGWSFSKIQTDQSVLYFFLFFWQHKFKSTQIHNWIGWVVCSVY